MPVGCFKYRINGLHMLLPLLQVTSEKDHADAIEVWAQMCHLAPAPEEVSTIEEGEDEEEDEDEEVRCKSSEPGARSGGSCGMACVVA